MKIDTLEKLYVDQLSSLKASEAELLNLNAHVLDALSHRELRDLIREELAEGQERLTRLEGVLSRAGHPEIADQGKESEGAQGLVKEAHVFLERASETGVIDAGLVAMVQRIGHYMIARYGAVRTYAELLQQDPAPLQASLDGLKKIDHQLTEIAVDLVNRDALAAG